MINLHPVTRKVYPLPPHIMSRLQDFVARRLARSPHCIISASDLWAALGRYEKKHGRMTAEVPENREAAALPTFEDVFRVIAVMTKSYILEDDLGRSYLIGVSL